MKTKWADRMSNPEYVKALDAARAETQRECPHNEFLKYGGPDRAVSCGKCGLRFVPPDVLEEALRGARACVSMVADEPNVHGIVTKTEAEALLLRIDALIDGVLGK
jgi:hypothetical protein